jgi:hypothetical protein
VSDQVFVVQEQPTGRWIAACCDERCGFGQHTLADVEAKPDADRAATVHRKLLATMPDEAIWPPKPSQCPSCGQSKAAIRALQELVRRLEQQLAEAGEQR